MRKLTLLTLLAMPCALAAQEPSALDSVQNIQEVVVRGARITAPNTVVKIPAPRREIPLTTNILPLEKIRLLGYSDPAQAMQTLPGVHAFKDYGGFHMFFLRGFYESVVLSDGMRDERHALWQSAPLTGMAAVSHIEVLKGAASMSVGHSALGGVINIINKQHFFCSFILSYYSFNSKYFSILYFYLTIQLLKSIFYQFFCNFIIWNILCYKFRLSFRRFKKSL